MARHNSPVVATTYAAARTFVDEALARPGSLFTPHKPVWTKATLYDLHSRFVAHPDESSDRLEFKLARQLADAPPDTIQVAAECMYVYFLVPHRLKGRHQAGASWYLIDFARYWRDLGNDVQGRALMDRGYRRRARDSWLSCAVSSKASPKSTTALPIFHGLPTTV